MTAMPIVAAGSITVFFCITALRLHVLLLLLAAALVTGSLCLQSQLYNYALHSAAVFNFVPGSANRFCAALRAADKDAVNEITGHCFCCFRTAAQQKTRLCGSLIKAGVKRIGRDAGDARAPLLIPSAEDTRLPEEIIQRSASLLHSLQHV